MVCDTCYDAKRECSLFYICFFKQKTAYEMRISDWSSDVCSSDLRPAGYDLTVGRRIGIGNGCVERGQMAGARGGDVAFAGFQRQQPRTQGRVLIERQLHPVRGLQEIGRAHV